MRIKPIYVIAAMLAIATLYFFQDPEWNGNSRLAATKAIVEEGTFRIDDYQAQPDWETMDKSVYQGHYYTDKGIASSLLAVPVYFVLYRASLAFHVALSSQLVKHILTAAVIGTSFVALGIVLYLIAEELTQNRWKAALATLAVTLGTMLWPYSVVYFGHVLAAFFVAAAFYLLFKARRVPDRVPGWRFFGAGLAMGLAFTTEYPTGLIIAGLAAYALYILWGKPAKVIALSGLAGAAGALIPLSVMLAYDAGVYGSVFRFSYSHVAVPAFQVGLEQGIMGISIPDPTVLYHFTFDPQFGIFWQSPVLVLAFVGFFVALKGRAWRGETILAAYCILSIFLMNAGYFMWWGGAGFGARYVIPALPFFIVPLALIPDRLTWLLGGLTVVSAGQMLIPLLSTVLVKLGFDKSTGHFWLMFSAPAPFHGFSIMYQYGLPLIFTFARHGQAPWNLGSAVGLPFEVSAALLVAVEAVLARLLYQTSKAITPARQEET